MIIKSLSGNYKISHLCKLVDVSKSGYYKWLNKSQEIINPKNIQNKLIESQILEVHHKYRGIYGKKRLCLYLNKIFDFKINHKRVYQLMKKLKIKSVIRKKVFCRKFKPSVIVENKLQRNFKAEKPLEKFSMDITYIPLKLGNHRFLYMNAIKDLFNNEICDSI